MKFTSLLSIVMLLASTEAVQLKSTLQTSSRSEAAKFKLNKNAAKERIAQAKQWATDEAAEAKEIAAQAKDAYSSGDYAGMVDVAKGGLDEIKKDGAGAKNWAQEAAEEQEE